MKISHFHLGKQTSRGRFGDLTGQIEGLRGVVGVVAVRSMGLMTVLYDERRVDAVAISDAVVRAVAEAAAEPATETASDMAADRSQEAAIEMAPAAESPPTIEAAGEADVAPVIELATEAPTGPPAEPARRPSRRGRAWARRAMSGL